MCFDVLRQSHQENQIRQTLTAIEKTKVSERMSCKDFPKIVMIRVSVQGVKSLGGHIAWLCQRFEFF